MGFQETLRGLSERSLTPEIMDDPALDAGEHERALNGLERINRFSFSARNVWSKVLPILKAHPDRKVRILDIATGGGDIPIAVSQYAKSSGLGIEIDACDLSARALTFAQERATRAGVAVRFFELDAVNQPIPDDYDVIVSSLFFHHLQSHQAGELLAKMGRSARLGVVVNDLLRSRSGWLLANAATRLLSTSHVVHVDGPLSVKAAFSLSEIQAMAASAGLNGCTIERRFPCRFLLSWRRTC